MTPNQQPDDSFWPRLYFATEAEGMEYRDAHIVTSSQYRYDCAIELAVCRGVSFDKIENVASELASRMPIEEFVDIQEEGILVVIDEDRIDDRVIQQVVKLLTRIQRFDSGQRISVNAIKSECLFQITPCYTGTA